MKITEKDKARFLEKVDVKGKYDCWEWKAFKFKGYGRFYLNGKHYAHRASWNLYNGQIPKGMCVLHHCDNPGCVNPEHLFLGTQLDNIKDMIKKGRFVSGELSGGSKLSTNQVIEIRNKYVPRKYTLSMLSNEYKVSTRCIWEILKNKTWRTNAS